MEFKKNQTIYLQIADFICENIITAKWPEDQKILSVREMAANIEVNPNTVMRTYSHLQDMEIIYNKRGIGYFVTKGAPTKIQKMQKKEFINIELPEFFKKLELLEIKFSELESIYKKSKSNGKKS